jgi:aryl-alcohol dehydrogenase-like predicted oxidoreductase
LHYSRKAFGKFRTFQKLTSSIPGTTKLQRLQENIGSSTVDLSPDDLEKINDSLNEIKDCLQ